MTNWDETKRKLKDKFSILTDNEWLVPDGNQDELLKRLELKLGKTREALRKLISEL